MARQGLQYTCLAVKHMRNHCGTLLVGVFYSRKSFADFVNYPLVVQGHVSNTGLDLSLIYDAHVLSEEKMDALAHHFKQVVQALVRDDSQILSSVSVAGEWDLERALAWNNAAFDINQKAETCIISCENTHARAHK